MVACVQKDTLKNYTQNNEAKDAMGKVTRQYVAPDNAGLNVKAFAIKLLVFGMD